MFTNRKKSKANDYSSVINADILGDSKLRSSTERNHQLNNFNKPNITISPKGKIGKTENNSKFGTTPSKINTVTNHAITVRSKHKR